MNGAVLVKSGQVKKIALGTEKTALLIFILLALVVRIGYSQLERVVKWDESDYLMLGRNLYTGRGFTTAGYPEVHYPPLLPLLFGFTYMLTHQPETASEIWYIVCGALLALPYYGLARRMYGQRISYLALALLLLFPALNIGVLYWGTMSEPPYLCLIYGGLYATWRALDEQKLAFHILAGLFLALAYLARPEGILYFALGFAWLILWRAFQRQLRDRKSSLGIIAYALVFVLCAMPYVLYLHHHTGKWTFSGKVGVTFALGEAVVERDPAAYDKATASLDESGHHIIWFSSQRFQSPGMWAEIQADPIGFARRVLANARAWEGLFFRKTVFPYFLLSAIVLGLCRIPWTRKRTRQELFLITALLPPFAFLALHIELRFFAPLFPILLLWVAKGMDDLGLWLRDTVRAWPFHRFLTWPGWDVFLRLCPLLFLLLYFALIQPAIAISAQQGTDFSQKRVGLWLRNHTPPEAKIMSRDVAVAVYADRAWIPSPHADYAAYLNYAKYHQADYLVIGQREATVLRPMLSFLMDEANPPSELELVHIERERENKTLVYRLR